MIQIKIDTASSGDNTLVSADSNRRIFVLAYHFVVSGALVITWKSGSTAISGAESYAANGGISQCSGNLDIPLLIANKNEALVLNLGGNVQISGSITYDYHR